MLNVMMSSRVDNVRDVMRVGIYLGVSSRAGGMLQYAQTLVEAISGIDIGHCEFFFVYDDPSWGDVLKRFDREGCQLHSARLGRLVADVICAINLAPKITRWFSRAFNPLHRELQSYRCDLWFFPAQESICYQLGTPFVSSIHDLMHRYERQFPEVGSWWRLIARENRLRNISKHASVIVVDSVVGKTHVMESFEVPSDRVVPLPYIVSQSIRCFREREGFERDFVLPAKFFFYPAQFWLHKNHRRLLEALRLNILDFPDIHLVLSGGRRLGYKSLKALVVSLGLSSNVTFVGYVSDGDMGGFYRRCRALVMPTFFGPTNIPPLEAIAFGKAAGLSDIYAMRERSEAAAIYFDPNSVQAIAAALRILWSDDSLVSKLESNCLEQFNKYGLAQFREILAGVFSKALLNISGRA